MFSIRDAVITGGEFRHQVTNVHQIYSPLDRLQLQVAHAAFHNSAQRIDAPRCHPNTRVKVKRDAHEWVMGANGTTAGASVMWLSGGAGAGKSAIAQSLAEEWTDQGILLASFFFSRSDPTRNHVGALVATLVAQILCLIPGTAKDLILQAFEEDPLVWSRDIFTQFHTLVAKPLHDTMWAGLFQNINSPRVFIIDGLDECLDRTMRGKVLELIRKAVHEWHLPCLFVIASRPEPDIVSTFESWACTHLHFRVNLSDNHAVQGDIERFLRDKFAECQRTHPFRQYIPPNWPSNSTIRTLVNKASGHFIYASVTVEFVTSTQHHPHRRLEIVLNLRPAASLSDTPFGELDALYSQILSAVRDFALLRRILSLHILTNSLTIYQIEIVLNLEEGDIELALSDLTSVVSLRVTKENQKTLHCLHASFQDYLFNPSRSKEYHINISQGRHEGVISLFSYLSLWLPGDDITVAADVCLTLRKCFRETDIHSSLSQCILSGFSFHLLFSNIACHMALKHRCHGSDFIINRLLDTIVEILAVLDASTSPFSSQISLKLRGDFDSVVLDLLEKLPDNNRLKLNIAAISRHTLLSYRVGDALCLDKYFVDMTVPNGHHYHLRDFPLHTKVPDNYFKELRRFFTDTSRSGKYAVSSDTLAGAAIFCIEYLQYCEDRHPSTKSFPQWSSRVSTLRKNCPHKWRHKSIFLIYNQKRITPTPPRALEGYFYSAGVPENNVMSGNWQTKQYQMALKHVIRLLPVAGHSRRLVETCDNPAFSSISLNFPRLSRLARSAIREYLIRWKFPLY